MMQDKYARIIWKYMQMHHQLRNSDCIITPTSHDLRVAEYSAKLFLEGWAPVVIFSGGGGGTRIPTSWGKPESEVFAEIAVKVGVPRTSIVIENKSSNTGENILFTKRLIASSLKPKTAIVVQKPYMERRVYAAFRKLWSELDIVVASPPISYDEYPTPEIPKDYFINIMVGDLERIMVYPARGFQIPQAIPQSVMEAYNELVARGYTKQHVQ